MQPSNMIPLKQKYQKEVIQAFLKQGYKNVMAIPKIVKVSVNSCYGKEGASKTGAERGKITNNIVADLTAITGQKPKVVKSKKSISGFKLRQGIDVAAVCTLRKDKMYDFLDKLINLTLPRLRDFRGLKSKSIDKKGNLSIGFKENVAFSEIVTEKEKTIFGLQVTVTTNAKNEEEGLKLFKLMGFPFK